MNEVVEKIIELDFYPNLTDDDINSDDYVKIPFAEIEALGVAFASLPHMFREVSNRVELNDVFKASVPKGTHMVDAKDGLGKIGACFDSSNHLVGQARFKEMGAIKCDVVIPYDPTMLFVAALLLQINKKLDVIQETQRDILVFLQRDKETKLEGDLKTLVGIINEYKFNWDNELFKSNNYKLTADIKRTAQQNIIFYRKDISDLVMKREMIQFDQKMGERMKKIQTDFKYYSLAIYLYGFSSFLEALLLENHDSKYLQSVQSQIENLSYKYREFYTECYERIEKMSSKTVETQVLDGAGKVNKFVGGTISKIPIVNKSPLDEAFSGAGEKLSDLSTIRSTKWLDRFDDNRVSGVEVFIDYLKILDQIYNQPKMVIFDNDILYMKAIEG